MDRQAGLASVLLVFGILVLGAMLYLRHVLQPPKLDDETLCLEQKPLEKASIIIIDETDKISGEQKNALRDRIQTLKNSIAQYELLAIYLVTDASPDEVKESVPLFYLCNPGKWEDGNPAYQNSKKNATSL